MSERGDLRGRLFEEIKSWVPEFRRRLAESLNQRGYDEASVVALEVVQTRIDGLEERVRSGGKLSAQEQYLLTSLRDVDTEMRRKLQDRSILDQYQGPDAGPAPAWHRVNE